MTSDQYARIWIFLGAALGAVGIAIGAFGAHWLQSAVKQWGYEPAEQVRQLEIWEVGVRYQMYQALAMIGLGLLVLHRPSGLYTAAGICIFLGTLIFSGCLYLLVLSGVRVLGAIVPIGGSLMIVGWVLLAVGAWRALAPIAQ